MIHITALRLIVGAYFLLSLLMGAHHLGKTKIGEKIEYSRADVQFGLFLSFLMLLAVFLV